MDADIDARPGDACRKREGGDRKPSVGRCEHRGARERDRRVPRRKGARVRQRNKRLRFGKAQRRPRPRGHILDEGRDEVCRERRAADAGEDARPPPRGCQRRGGDQPDGTEIAYRAERLEERVEQRDSMGDDPVREPLIERGQTGRSCFADSTSARGSKGLPMKPWAPRDAASVAERSSALPLNMITGNVPTPWRSCTCRSISQPST